MSPADLLRIEPSEDSANRLIVAGQLDAFTAGQLDDAITQLRATTSPLPSLELDLSGITFLDSSGIRVLVRAHNTQRKAGDEFIIVTPSETVRRLLSLGGLLDHFDIAN